MWRIALSGLWVIYEVAQGLYAAYMPPQPGIRSEGNSHAGVPAFREGGVGGACGVGKGWLSGDLASVTTA